jgi:catechol 2,3-dioxygenase-like lactoylglutathione lyase family enzyme
MIKSLDHLVLTVADIDRTIAFYTTVLGMREVQFGDGRIALQFGTQKINLHLSGKEFAPHACRPGPGSADLCFLIDTDLDTTMQHLDAHNIPIELGPVMRTGAMGDIESLYIRDPDGNLLELARQK